MSRNRSGTMAWIFRWWETLPDGRRVRRKRQVGKLNEYQTEAAAERAVRSWRLAVKANQAGVISGITMKTLIDHFRETEMVDKGEDGRAWSAWDRYEVLSQLLDRTPLGNEKLNAIKAPLLEEWLRKLKQRPLKRKRNQ